MGFWHMWMWNHIHLCFKHRIIDRYRKVFYSLPRKMAHSSLNTKTPAMLQKVWHNNEYKPALNILHPQVLSKGIDKLKAVPWAIRLLYWKAGSNTMYCSCSWRNWIHESILHIPVTITNAPVWELATLQKGAPVWCAQLWHTIKYIILMI